MPDPLQISVTSATDRQTQREQIDEVLVRARAAQQPLRVRIPFTLYDQDTTRGYVNVRDAAWNMQLPSEGISAETIEELIATVGACILAIGAKGSVRVRELLEERG